MSRVLHSWYLVYVHASSIAPQRFRLTSPPEEIYSLHRKLSGSYLLATKLKAVVSCGGLFNEIYDNYSFGEDGKDIDIDSPTESSETAP